MEDLIVEFKKGDVLFEEGEATKDLFIIQKGIVRVYRKATDGGIWPLALVHSGGFVGEMAFFDGKPRSATADAVTDVTVLKLEAVKLEHEIKKLPPWVMVMVKGLAQRVREVNDLVKRNKLVDETTKDEFERWSASMTTTAGAAKK
jgi:CRP-like cAMP-binding protein